MYLVLYTNWNGEGLEGAPIKGRYAIAVAGRTIRTDTR